MRRRQKSSRSDRHGYLEVVRGATKNWEAFESFRAHPDYTNVLDHVNCAQGSDYLEILKLRQAFDLTSLHRFASFSEQGGPARCDFGSLGRVSPTLFRYLKVASDIQILFPDLSRASISELGVGWGAQAWILSEAGQFSSFILCDLPEVIRLSRKMLSAVGATLPRVEFHGTRRKIPKIRSDLFMSNYAMSELSPALQLSTLDNLARNATRGYVTWNPSVANGLNEEMLRQAIPSSTTFPEIPNTGGGNFIWLWGHSASGAAEIFG